MDSKTGEGDSIGDSAIRVQPNEDAVDYTDIQELAEDIAPKPAALVPSFFRPSPLPNFRPSTGKQPSKTAISLPKIKGRLKFSEVFASHVATVPQAFRSKNLPGRSDDCYACY